MTEAIRQGDIPGVQLRYRKNLEASAERVWAWLTEPHHQVKWLATEVDSQGDASVISGPSAERERWETRQLTSPRRWAAHLERTGAGWEVATPVTFEVTPAEVGCELMVFQSGFEQLRLSIGLTEWERYRRRWREAFDRLEEALASVEND